jgi:hypothetical protein
MDITTLLGAVAIAMMQGMGPEGAARAAAALHQVAKLASSPAERHILQAIAEAVDGPSTLIRKPFTVIQGGAA